MPSTEACSVRLQAFQDPRDPHSALGGKALNSTRPQHELGHLARWQSKAIGARFTVSGSNTSLLIGQAQSS